MRACLPLLGRARAARRRRTPTPGRIPAPASDDDLSDEDLADLRSLTWSLVRSGRLDESQANEVYAWHRWAEAKLGIIDGPDEENDDEDEEEEEDMAASEDEEVEKIAKRFRDADPTLTKEQAFDKAAQTPEGAAAYERRDAERRPAAFRKLLEDQASPQEKIAKGLELSSADRIEVAANAELRRDPSLTKEQAFDKVLRDDRSRSRTTKFPTGEKVEKSEPEASAPVPVTLS
jgi:hypothetical protein